MTYPDDLPARVLALVEGEGYSIKGAAEKMGVPERTAWDWVSQAREVTIGNKPLLDRWHRRVSKSLDLMQRGLDYIEEDDSNLLAYKSLQTLNIIAGTGTDKLQKQADQLQPQHPTQVLIVLNCTTPQDVVDKAQDYIEGEVKDADTEMAAPPHAPLWP